MKSKLLILLSVAFISVGILSFTGCKKYPDGPTISLASKKARFANTWKISAILINGVEQSFYSSSTWDVKKDGTWIDTDVSSSDTGTWAFSSDKESVTISYTDNSSADTYKILKLKSKELWLEETSGTDKFEVHYEPK
jgi:hypothetical protein